MTSPSSERCFVDQVTEPVRWMDLVPAEDATHQAILRSESFSNLESLRNWVDTHGKDDYSCRFISICQRNSWRPLQITQQMMSLIANEHGLSDSFWALPSCFYTRNLDLEEAFCVPLTMSRNGSWLETVYTLRYPEYKENDEQWSMRQSGICHLFNIETRQTVFMLFSPKPSSKGHKLIEQRLLKWQSNGYSSGFLDLHDILFTAHLPAWRQYVATQEAEFLPMANSTFATFIDEPLHLGYDQLSAMVSSEGRFTKAISLVASTTELLSEMKALLKSDTSLCTPSEENFQIVMSKLDNQIRQCASYSRAATYLQHRVQAASQLLANTLSFREQVIAKEQSGNMLQLNKSAVFITTLTLIYAPASFAATFFGMNFFAMDQPNSSIVCTSMIWIYLVSAAVLTGITVVFYYWLLQHDGVLFWRLAPKIKTTPDWGALVRRFTKLDQRDVDLQNLSRSV